MINPDLAHKAWLDIWNRDRKRLLTKEIDAVSEATRNLPGIKQTLDQYDRYQNWKQEGKAKQRAYNEQKGGFHAFLNRVEDGTNLAHQALGMPIEAVSRVTNIDPRAIGAAATVAAVGKSIKFPTTISKLPVKKTIKGKSKYASDKVVDTTAYSPVKPKANIPKYSSGPIVQTKEGTFYRPTERLASQFAYSKEAGPKNTIWRVDGLADKKKFMSEVVKPWVNENKQALMTKDLKRTALGTVFYNNELYRIQGLSEHLATSGKAKLNLVRVGQDASRKYQLDPSTIQVVTDYLDKANKGFIDSKGELGVNPEHLNAAIFRKSIKKGAGLMDKITSELGKLFKQNLDKEHAFGALSSEGFGHDDYVSQFSGDRAFNIRLRKLNAFIQSQADALGIPGKGILPNSKKIHPRRAAMEEQYGWLQSVTNRAMKARELGDNPFTAELKDLTRQYGTLVQGSTKGVGQVPGNPLSMAEMVKLQQRGLKGDKQAAVETILAERDVLNKAIEAGLAEEPDTIAILKKYLTNIDIDQQIITAKKDAAKRLKEEKTYKYEGRSLGHYPKEKFKRLPRAEPKRKKQPKITESMWKALKDWELIDARSNRPWINR